MIRTLVVDDDFRVARIHASRVAKIEGYECVGEAHTAAEAREAVQRLKPDLLLLDVYLPDEDGISLLRSLQGAGEKLDAVMITAARDLETVRAAMRGGAVYYLVKPFGFEQLQTQLEAYRRWRQEAESRTVADQATVDQLFSLRRTAPPCQSDPGGCHPRCKKSSTWWFTPRNPWVPRRSRAASESAALRRSAISVNSNAKDSLTCIWPTDRPGGR